MSFFHFSEEQIKEISSPKKRKNMKKLLLTPTKDSITICLPSEWVGKPISCILQREAEEFAGEAHEAESPYNEKYRNELEELWNCESEDEIWKNI